VNSVMMMMMCVSVCPPVTVSLMLC